MTELAIIEVPKEKALELFTKANGLDELINPVIKQVKSIVPNLETKKGRDEIASLAYKISKSKTAIDKVGKEVVDELKEKPKLVDAERKRVRDLLDGVRDQVRKPLTDWENEEEKRVDDIKQRISDFTIEDITRFETSTQIASMIEHIKSVEVDESFEEFQSEAIIARDAALMTLDSHYSKLLKDEQERAELEKLRAEKEAREAKEREEAIAKEAEERAKREAAQEAEKQRIEAEKAAQAEREQAEKRELELKLAAQEAEREKLEAERRAEQAEKAAKQKLLDEAEAEKAAAEKREANKRHRTKINNQALKAIAKSGITQDQAKEIVILIAKGEVPNVSIQY